MSYVVTGATGHLGRLVVDALLERGVPAGEIVAAGREVSKIADLGDRGVRVARIDFAVPATLSFAAGDRVLLVSGSEPGARVAQHGNVVDAAVRDGAGLLAYTSIPAADSNPMVLAADHRATEALVRASGLPFALLRNSWYHENYTAQVSSYLSLGAVYGSAGEGRVSGAARADYAAAAAAVLLGGLTGVYELGGDDAYTMADLARAVGDAAGREIEYRDLPEADYADVLVGAGLPEWYARALADSDRGIARGDLLVRTGDLSRLIGRPTVPLATAVGEAVESAGVRRA